MTDKLVVCPECKAQGLKSTVTLAHMASTLMYWEPYYDEDGRLHAHDPNNKWEYYDCSRGHEFRLPRLCWCGWPKKG